MYIIGGKHKKRRLFSPKTDEIRPTSSQLREAVFNICQFEIENATFLDLFAGSGAMGLEALSRGASHVTFVEKHKNALTILKKNIELLKEGKNVSILAIDAFKAIEKLDRAGKEFDLIFADPPYGTKEFSLSDEIILAIDQTHLLAQDGLLFVEDALAASQKELELYHLETLKRRKFGRALLRIYKSRDV